MMDWYWFREEPSFYETLMAEDSLYVGDLEPSVTESVLFDAFSLHFPVRSVRVCKDLTTRKSLGYGYVSFYNPHEAKLATGMLPFTNINGKDVRVMKYVHNPSLKKRGVGNIFIKNLEESISHKGLYYIFSSFGCILRYKVATNASGQSKGFAFVQYENEESADEAIRYINGLLLNDVQVYVGHFLQRDSPNGKEMFTNIYVKNLSKSLTDEELNKVFQEFGPTTNCVIIRDGEVLTGKSKGYGFVNFENPKDAEKAVEALNGKKFEEKEWYVTKSKKKYHAESDLKRALKQAIKSPQSLNYYLCVKKLHKSVTDEILRDYFSVYGTITSCKVMRDSSGVSKGSGFVSFSKPEEASKAMEEINGRLKMENQVYADLAIALANGTPPEQQRTMIGENLYHMVEQVEPKFAAKITGMILEMEQTQVLHLLEFQDALQSKVTEAMNILRRTVYQQRQKQLGVMSKESPVKEQSVSDLKDTKSVNNPPAKHSSSDHKLTKSAKKKRRPARGREMSTLLLSNRCDALEATNVIRSGESPVEHSVSDHKYTESVNNSEFYSNPSPCFKSPKPRSLARVNNRTSMRERSGVSLTNRFDSLNESQSDED